MTDVVIKVEDLGKRYRIGAQQARYPTLRDAIMASFRNLVPRPRSEPDGNGTIWALKDVSFEVRQGEVVGIIGRNGAGKSTLLKVLSHITEPTEGRVRLRGRVGSLLEVGTGFHSELTGRENIYLNGAILGMRKAEIDRKFDEMVSFAEIEKFLDTPVKHYSSGMYVRLAFAVAAHLDPEILLVDEVLAVGDAAFQKKCLGKMGDVAREGRTVLFVSHSMAAIRSLCLWGLVLKDGHIAAGGPTPTAIDAYITDTCLKDLPNVRDFSHTHAQKMYIERVFLTGQDGSPSSRIRHEQNNRLAIDYCVQTPVDGAYVCSEFRNAEDVPVYWVSDMDSQAFKERRAGRFRATFEIPERFFPAGCYSLHVAIYAPGRHSAEHAIYYAHQFEVVDEGSMLAARGISFPAVISLPAKVTTQSIGESAQ